jgi:hypothetical protein
VRTAPRRPPESKTVADCLAAVWAALFPWCPGRRREHRRHSLRPTVEALEGRSLPSAVLPGPAHAALDAPGLVVAPRSVRVHVHSAVASRRHHHPHKPHHARHRVHPARVSVAPPPADSTLQDALHLAQSWLFPF